jgi:hypothetical protein
MHAYALLSGVREDVGSHLEVISIFSPAKRGPFSICPGRNDSFRILGAESDLNKY